MGYDTHGTMSLENTVQYSELKSESFAYMFQAHQKPCEVIRWHHKTVLAIIGALLNKCDARES